MSTSRRFTFDSPRRKSGFGSAPLPADLEIDDARQGDLDQIARLEAAAFPAPWRREFFESELRASGRLARVVRDDLGNVIAYLFAMYFLDELHINKIAVREQWRRRGVARALMEDCIAFGRRKDLKLLSLEVRESNTGAQEFYRTLHFAPSYRRARYYPDGEAAIVMTAEI